MKQIYILRHAQTNSAGELTESGKNVAIILAKKLPVFDVVVSSPHQRAIQTAQLLTGKMPKTDERASFYMAAQQNSDAINSLAKQKKITFFEAVQIFDNKDILKGMYSQANKLYEFINELLDQNGKNALIISHDFTICPTLQKWGRSLVSLDNLNGAIIYDKDRYINYPRH
ncbi:histidine phosphatase family protein [Candidatus Saccharibacteria bacterium]|nr:histidine phosphatase family protein [Candidatus Saccharibacteria bacterium]